MAFDAPADVTFVTTAPSDADTRSYVDWPAIFAGILLATAISVVLLTFGSAVGLSFVNFRAGPDVSAVWIAIAAASWLLWVQVSSFMAGGYLTGRMRRRAGDASEHEVDVRDGAHGLIVWAGASVLGAALILGGLGSVASTVGGAASAVTSAASNVAGAAVDKVDPNAYFVDTLFRRAVNPAAPATPGAASADDTAARAEAGRIFAQAAIAGQLAPEDRTYLAQVVSANTGIPQAEAETRVDQTMTAVQNAKAQAADLAEKARKTSVMAAFLIAASFFISAVGAYWAASMGGRHRDEGTVFDTVFRRY
jgi:hypothetical protein